MASLAVHARNGYPAVAMSTSDQQSLQALAFLYLTFGHATDGTMTGDEMRALAKRLQPWAPQAGLDDLGEVLKQTVAEYKSHEDMDAKLAKARELTATLGKNASADELQRILDDLREIASADGTISEEEKAFIADTAKTFGLPSEA